MADSMGDVQSGTCALACGCQMFWKPSTPGNNDCEGCSHHLSFHSCGVDECKWQLVKTDEDGEPCIDPVTRLPLVKRRCKCSKLIESAGGKKCEGCGHHQSFHKPLRPPSSTLLSPSVEALRSVTASASPVEGSTATEAPNVPPAKVAKKVGSGKTTKASQGQLVTEELDPLWIKNLDSKSLSLSHSVIVFVLLQAEASGMPFFCKQSRQTAGHMS